MVGPIDMERKGSESYTTLDPTMQPRTLTSTMPCHWIIGFSRWNFKIMLFPDGWYGTKGTWIDRMMVTLCDFTHDLGLGFPRLNFALQWRHNKQRVLMHRHQGWNVRHGLCHIYIRYLYIYELFIAFVCFVVCSLLYMMVNLLLILTIK